VLSALGFYPVCHGSNQYVLGTPLFKKATIHLENGKNVVINAPYNNVENRFIKRVKLKREAYTKNYLKHTELMNGAEIEIEMDDTPNKKRE
jgi:putative alpha-1,2-mannosidase